MDRGRLGNALSRLWEGRWFFGNRRNTIWAFVSEEGRIELGSIRSGMAYFCSHALAQLFLLVSPVNSNDA